MKDYINKMKWVGRAVASYFVLAIFFILNLAGVYYWTAFFSVDGEFSVGVIHLALLFVGCYSGAYLGHLIAKNNTLYVVNATVLSGFIFKAIFNYQPDSTGGMNALEYGIIGIVYVITIIGFGIYSIKRNSHNNKPKKVDNVSSTTQSHVDRQNEVESEVDSLTPDVFPILCQQRSVNRAWLVEQILSQANSRPKDSVGMMLASLESDLQQTFPQNVDV